MSRIFKRLKAKNGETLVESMASILVVTMASIVLLTMISTATKINKEADALSKVYNEGLQYVERAEGTPDITATVEIKLYSAENQTGAELGTAKVSVYRHEESGLYAFYHTK